MQRRSCRNSSSDRTALPRFAGTGPDNGLSGLEFKPSKVGGLPELTGVIWLDPRARTLRYVNFDYVNLPVPLRLARTTGRVEFQQLPGGQWIVPRWYIRMPRTARVAQRRSQTVVRDSLVGYQEVGGTARPAGAAFFGNGGKCSPAAAGTAQATEDEPAEAPSDAVKSVLTGVVYDSTTGRPMKGVEVSTGGGQFKAVTSDGGRYELVVIGGLSDKVIFEHTRLRLFRIPERVQHITVPAGSRGQAVVIVPSLGTLRKRLCGQNETGTDAQGHGGRLRERCRTGVRYANAHVWATWQISWVQQNGRLVSTNQQRTVETDTGPDGSYMMCGFTAGAQVTAKVSIAGRNTVQEKLLVPGSLVLEHDFQFGRAIVSSCSNSVARRDYPGAFHHQDDRLLRRSRAVHDAFGHDESLARLQHDSPILEIDQEKSLDDVEELVEIVVLVPVILSLHDTDSHDRVVDPAQRLVEPTDR